MVHTGDGGKVFTKTGTLVYVTNKNNYILPMQLSTQLILTVQYGFVFFIFLTKQKKITINKSQQEVLAKDVLVIMCQENDYEVVGISESCKKLIGLDSKYLSTKELGTERDFLSLYDLLGQIRPLIKFSSLKNIDYLEENVDIDSNIVLNLIHSLRAKNSVNVQARLSI
jgi:hypothetical protein